jgi:CubicO group peptidase (beta-lactamase class C family)
MGKMSIGTPFPQDEGGIFLPFTERIMLYKRRLNMNWKSVVSMVSASLILTCLFVAPGRAQTTDPLKTDGDKQALVGDLEKTIPELMKEANIPGLSIAVIRDGKLLWTRGFGVKNAKTGEPVTEDTIFEAASLTKPFFAYAAMKMVESGELDLDRPLIEYIPREKVEKGLGHSLDLEGFRGDWFRRITARMVLSHSSGLPHGERGKPYPLFFEPGTKFRYSADGYYYLQAVIEHLKGEPLDVLMKKWAIDPLGMEASSMVWQERYEKSAAVGHDLLGETDGRFRKRTQAHAAATLYTTAGDYAKFVMAMLNDVGLKKETIDLMLTPQIDVAENVFWGLGFGLEKTPEGMGFWQWGDYGIFRNYIVAYKKQKIGVVYLTNSFNGLSIAQDIVSHAIGGGRDLGIAYLNYNRYDSPSSHFLKAVLEKGTVEAKKLYYETRKDRPGDLDEATINQIGYSLMNAKKYKEAIEVLKLNVESYPGSTNVYDSLAEAYLNSGDKEMAITYYKKVLEMAPKDTKTDKDFLERIRTGAVEKLKELEKNQ